MTSTIPTTLTEYQEFVRKEALQVQLDMNLSDEKLNTMLRNLGLPEKRTFHVPVEVTGTMAVMLPVSDTLTEEEARESITALTPEELRRKVQSIVSTGHFGKLAVKPTEIPDPATAKVGDADFTLANSSIYASMQTREERRQCENTKSDHSWYCTLRRGHEGQHVAGNGITVQAVWPNA